MGRAAARAQPADSSAGSSTGCRGEAQARRVRHPPPSRGNPSASRSGRCPRRSRLVTLRRTLTPRSSCVRTPLASSALSTAGRPPRLDAVVSRAGKSQAPASGGRAGCPLCVHLSPGGWGTRRRARPAGCSLIRLIRDASAAAWAAARVGVHRHARSGGGTLCSAVFERMVLPRPRARIWRRGVQPDVAGPPPRPAGRPGSAWERVVKNSGTFTRTRESCLRDVRSPWAPSRPPSFQSALTITVIGGHPTVRPGPRRGIPGTRPGTTACWSGG